MARTDREIVDQTNSLARLCLKEMGVGYEVPEGHIFYNNEDPRAKKAWRMACEIQEFMTNTDPEDALSALDTAMTVSAPTGAEIVSSLEILPGTCGGSFVDGEFTLSGSTVVDWDNQKTVIRAGQRVYLDEQGNEWLESQLVKPGQLLPAIVDSPWDDVPTLRLLIGEHWNAIAKIISDDKRKTIRMDDMPEPVFQMLDKVLNDLAAAAKIIRDTAD